MVFEDSEQVGVNHIATKADTETAESATGENEYQISMRSMTSAVRMLQERLSVICQYVRAVEAGALPPDNEILIELKRIIDLLESLDSDEQKEKYSVVSPTISAGKYNVFIRLLITFLRVDAPASHHDFVSRDLRADCRRYDRLHSKNVVVIDRRGQQKMMRAMGGPGGFPHRGPGGFFPGQNKVFDAMDPSHRALDRKG